MVGGWVGGWAGGRPAGMLRALGACIGSALCCAGRTLTLPFPAAVVLLPAA